MQDRRQNNELEDELIKELDLKENFNHRNPLPKTDFRYTETYTRTR